MAAVGALPLGEPHGRGLERVGLDRLCPGIEVGAVNLLDHVRSGDRQIVHSTLKRPAAVVIGSEVACLNLRAHPAVEDDDTLLEGREIVTGVLHVGEA